MDLTLLFSGLAGALIGGVLAIAGSLLATWRVNVASQRLQETRWKREESRAYTVALERISPTLNALASQCVKGLRGAELESLQRELIDQIHLAMYRCQSSDHQKELFHLHGAVFWAVQKNRSGAKALADWKSVTEIYHGALDQVFGELDTMLDEYVQAGAQNMPLPDPQGLDPTDGQRREMNRLT